MWPCAFGHDVDTIVFKRRSYPVTSLGLSGLVCAVKRVVPQVLWAFPARKFCSAAHPLGGAHCLSPLYP